MVKIRQMLISLGSVNPKSMPPPISSHSHLHLHLILNHTFPYPPPSKAVWSLLRCRDYVSGITGTLVGNSPVILYHNVSHACSLKNITIMER